VGVDILAFERTRGLFAGISLTGSLLSAYSEWNRIYYGQPMATQQIVLQMQGRNVAADPLRAVLTRYGMPAPRPGEPGYQPPGGGPASANTPQAADAAVPQPLQPVQQQSLPPAPAGHH
jgi:hypothetical protein